MTSPASAPSPGPIALVGSGEFMPATEAVDRALLDTVRRRRAGAHDDGYQQRAVIIPVASGQEGSGSVNRWLDLGAAHYRRLGIEPTPLPIVDAASANDAELAAQIQGADLIYFSGGDPAYVSASMRGSFAWDAVLEAWQAGSALAGCSAGAMMMGSLTGSPRQSGLSPALGIFEDLVVLPHFDRMESFRPGRTNDVINEVGSETVVLGVDEDTGLVQDDLGWAVIGRQNVWLLAPGERRSFRPGERVPFDHTPISWTAER